MSKWISFFLDEKKPKTEVWRIETKEGKNILGYVKWFTRWRKYSFFPETDTVYENDCLRDIADFIEYLMRERNQSKK